MSELGDPPVILGEKVDDPPRLTPEEVSARISALDELELQRLYNFGRRLEGIYPGISGDDLLHETFCLLMTGARTCSRTKSVFGSIMGIMRSLASNEVGSVSRRRRVNDVELDALWITDGDGPKENAESLAFSEERFSKEEALVRDIRARFEAKFAGDEEMWLLLEGVIENHRGEELRQIVGVDVKRLATLRKRLARFFEDVKREAAVTS